MFNSYIPEDVIYEFILKLDIVEAINLLISNTELSELARTPRLLNDLANEHGLPYSKSLVKLVDYSLMSPTKLLIIASDEGDLRVVTGIVNIVSVTDKLASDYNTSLERAVENGHLDIANILIDAGARDLFLVLSNASAAGYIDIVGKLIKTNSYTLQEYNTELASAAAGNHLNVVDMLIGVGANDYDNALVAAAQYGNLDIVNRLADGVTNYDKALLAAAGHGHRNVVEMLITNGIRDYNRALIAAARHGHLGIVDILITTGARDYDDAMIAAAGNGHLGVVNKLLKVGAISYDRALIYATENGHLDIVDTLIVAGAEDYDAALMEAASNGHIGIVKLLIKAGAEEYDWALVEAIEGGHQDVADILTEAGARDYEDIIESQEDVPDWM